MDRFHAELGRSGRAVEGLANTAAAVREANVECLLVNRSALAGHTAGAGDEADEAIPAAALAVGAEIVPTGDEENLADGVGAILRHT
jgi:hypothetical protein